MSYVVYKQPVHDDTFARFRTMPFSAIVQKLLLAKIACWRKTLLLYHAYRFYKQKIMALAQIYQFSPKISYFSENRASRRPYKAPDFLKSRGTALFIIFYYRSPSEPTEAFGLCLRVKNGSRRAKMGIFGAILVFLGKFWCFFCNFEDIFCIKKALFSLYTIYIIYT